MPDQELAEIDTTIGRFSRVPTLAELERFAFLTDTDRALTGKRRGEHNRLGFALQLVTVRLIGSFLEDPLDVPTAVVDFVAHQLEVADPSCLKHYVGRRKTPLEHQWELAREYGWRPFADAEAELAVWIHDRVWSTGDGPAAVLEACVTWLREHRVLLPGPSTLDRLVARVHEDAEKELWDLLAALPTPPQAEQLVGLLSVPKGATFSDLERLRRGPTTASAKSMLAALGRCKEINAFGLTCPSMVPPRRLLQLARYGMAAKAPALRRHPRGRRLAVLVATLDHLRARAIDDALEVFDLLMTTDLLARARRESKEENLRRYPDVRRDAGRLAVAMEAVLQLMDSGSSVTAESIWRAIEQAVPRADVRSAVAHLRQVAPAPKEDPDAEWRGSLVQRYPLVRSFLPSLLETVRFGAQVEARPLLDAVATLPGLMEARPTISIPAGHLDARRIASDLVPAAWRRIVLPAGRPEGTVHRAGYVFCLLEQFHQALVRRDIFAAGSSRWADPRARLLRGEAWAAVKDSVLNALQLPEDPDGLLAKCAAGLDEQLRDVAGRLEPGVDAAIDTDGRLHAAKLAGLTDPPSLTRLRAQVDSLLPMVDIGELVLEVMSWVPGFLAAFKPLSGGVVRMDDLQLSVVAALVAEGLNIDFVSVVNPGVPALRANRISHVDQNYLRAETYAAAAGELVRAQAGMAFAEALGGGLVAGVDGMRFVVSVPSLAARPNPKYFGRGRGATWLNMLNDRGVGLAGMVVSGTPRDSLHVIDLIYRQEAGARPEVVISDAGSYSDIVFGLLALLGFDYRPQPADLPDARLWCIDPASGYGPLSPALRGRIDLGRIRRQWPEMLRVVASIHTGAVSAHDILRMLARGGGLTALGEALAHYGRIFKTTHILTYVDDEPYRRQIKGMRNLQEGRHDLARRLFHGGKGELAESYQEGMEDQLGALGLLLNCVALWNTVYTDLALARLRAQGEEVRDDDVAHLSVYVRHHINVDGHYSFHLPDLGGHRRPLRDAAGDALPGGK